METRKFADGSKGTAMNERNASHIETLVKNQNSWRETCLNLIAS